MPIRKRENRYSPSWLWHHSSRLVESRAFLGTLNNRSIIDALIARIFGRIVSSSFRCPLRSNAGKRIGSSAMRRLPQTRSEASHITISAARAASS